MHGQGTVRPQAKEGGHGGSQPCPRACSVQDGRARLRLKPSLWPFAPAALSKPLQGLVLEARQGQAGQTGTGTAAHSSPRLPGPTPSPGPGEPFPSPAPEACAGLVLLHEPSQGPALCARLHACHPHSLGAWGRQTQPLQPPVQTGLHQPQNAGDRNPSLPCPPQTSLLPNAVNKLFSLQNAIMCEFT